jgi:predicted ATPase
MAIHTGDARLDAGEATAEGEARDYHGGVLNRASRVLSAGHGGQILVSEAGAALLRRDLPPGVELTDLGAYRLRDVPGPERLYQASYAGMGLRIFPPPRANPAHPTSLPPYLTHFFGRVAELARLGEMLRTDPAPDGDGDTGAVRLLTLTGPGGTGKTRLAVETAARLAEPLAGAVWFAGLSELTDPALIVPTVRGAMGLPNQPGADPFEQVSAALSRQPSLLVLDNFEQLVEAGGPAVVRDLLARAPTLSCLVTSRQVLGLAGEWEFPVGPLPTPPAWEQTPEGLMEVEGVRLFADRARASRPDFQVTRSNARAVAELVSHLEGIPLALELAAARAAVMSPAQMLGQLANRLDFFASRQREVVARHRTLRAAIDWSYQLLTPELRRFFARLSVFRGGWTAEAAEQVCGEPVGGSAADPALDLLEQLRECSLIVAEESPGTGDTRFRMLETLRQYAQERLVEAGERAAVQVRHRDHFLSLAEETKPKLYGPEQTRLLTVLDEEHDNLRQALRLCREEEDAAGIEAGLRLAASLEEFWWMRGHWSEGREHVTALLSRPGAREAAGARVGALNVAGTFACLQVDWAAAQSLFEEALALARELGDKGGIAESVYGLGTLAWHHGDLAAARAWEEERLALARELGDRRVIASALNRLGNIANRQGDYAAGLALLEESLAMKRELGDTQGILTCLYCIAVLAFRQGDYRAARALYEECLAKARAGKLGIHGYQEARAVVADRQGDHGEARALLEEFLATCREQGDKVGIAGTKGGIALYDRRLGVVALHQGDFGEARAVLEQGLAIERELGDRLGNPETLYGLGVVALHQGDYAEARALLEQSLAIQRDREEKGAIPYSLAGLGVVALHQGDYAEARALLDEGLALFRELGDKGGIAESLEAFASLALKEGEEKGEARCARLWGAAAALRDAIGAPLPPMDRPEQERDLAAVRAALGEAAFAAAWEAGRAMTWKQAVAYASGAEA